MKSKIPKAKTESVDRKLTRGQLHGVVSRRELREMRFAVTVDGKPWPKNGRAVGVSTIRKAIC